MLRTNRNTLLQRCKRTQALAVSEDKKREIFLWVCVGGF